MSTLVVTDLDGTFWNEENVPDAHHEAIVELERRRIPILAATARRPRHVTEPFATLGLSRLPAACLDGAIGLDGGMRFCDRHFERADLVTCLDTMADLDIRPCLYVLEDDCDIVVAENASTCTAHLRFIADHSRVADLATVAATTPVYALSVMGRPRTTLEPVVEALRALGTVSTVAGDEPIYGGWAMTVGPTGVTKWSAVEAFCAYRNLGRPTVVAVGDGPNDLALLEGADVAIGVRGGHPDVVAIADHLIDPPAGAGWGDVPGLLETLGLDGYG